jgi:hypothetical protein
MLSEIDHKIIHEVALDNFIKDNVVEDIILSIEHSVAKIISEADVCHEETPIINLTNFGKFVVSITRRKFIKGQNDKRNKDIDEGEENNCEGTSVIAAVAGVE